MVEMCYQFKSLNLESIPLFILELIIKIISSL